VVAASAATVEVAVAEKKEDETGLQEREGVAVAAWWLCRLPMVELVFVAVYRLGLLVFSSEKAVVERWRELQKADGERRKMKTGGRLVFCDFWTRISPPSGHEIHLYL
jgi:hypothetical protein